MGSGECSLTQSIGYVIIQIHVDGVQGYDEDQIVLVIPDLSNFAAQIPVILGTPTIGCVMNVIKESEMDMLLAPPLGQCPSEPTFWQCDEPLPQWKMTRLPPKS